MTRGRCGSLPLHRTTLAFATPRRFNPAHGGSHHVGNGRHGLLWAAPRAPLPTLRTPRTLPRCAAHPEWTRPSPCLRLPRGPRGAGRHALARTPPPRVSRPRFVVGDLPPLAPAPDLAVVPVPPGRGGQRGIDRHPEPTEHPRPL